MFCTKCGANLPDGTAFCSSCGRPQGQPANAQQPQEQQPAQGQPYAQQPYYLPINPAPTNGMAIAGLACSLFGVTCLFGLIFSIVGLVQSKKHPSKPGRGLAIAGIIISSCFVLLYVAIIVFAIIMENAYSYSSPAYPSYYY